MKAKAPAAFAVENVIAALRPSANPDLERQSDLA
jgi:hypothetical protein